MGRWFESNTAHQIKLVQPEMNQLSSILSKIIQLHNEGNFLKSKPLILEILKKDKNNPEFLKLLSFTELQVGNLKEAIRIINKKQLQLNETNISNSLYTKDIPDPEILIRTGNTNRLSNFLLWQINYTEIFFVKKLWPDFGKNDFNIILNKFNRIKRNFGAI